MFLFDLIGSDFAQQQSLNAIYFVRPSDKNIKLICKHLNPADHPPAFGQYYLPPLTTIQLLCIKSLSCAGTALVLMDQRRRKEQHTVSLIDRVQLEPGEFWCAFASVYVSKSDAAVSGTL